MMKTVVGRSRINFPRCGRMFTTTYDKDLVDRYRFLYDNPDEPEISPLAWLLKGVEDAVIIPVKDIYSKTNKKLTIMDVACGLGHYVARAYSLSLTDDIVGIDISDDMIGYAKTEYNDLIKDSSNVKFETMDVCDLIKHEEYHNKFDVINASFLYNYARNTDELTSMMSSVYSCLKPNGGLHTGITLNPQVINDNNDSLNKYGIQVYFDNSRELDYKPSIDGEIMYANLMMNSQDKEATPLIVHWYSKNGLINCFKNAKFDEKNIQLIHPKNWTIENDNDCTLNEKEKKLFKQYANGNPEMILFQLTKN